MSRSLIPPVKVFLSFLKPMAKYGWYIAEDYPIFHTMEIADMIEKKEMDKVDLEMKRFYEKNLNSVKDKLVSAYPERSEIIKEAFMAHKKKLFFASIPLFLIQADGICEEKLFLRRNEKAELRKIIFKNDTPKEIIELLTLITKENSIDKRYYNSKKNKILNRHGVIHGLDLKYGTMINSYKAMSLLCFIGGFFERHKRIPVF